MTSTPAGKLYSLVKKMVAAWLPLTAWLLSGSLSSAATITGTVMNLSSNKPSSGDEVILYRVDKSMHEVMRAKANRDGTFQFESAAGSRYLVAAMHEKISYHTQLLGESGHATVFVYDAATRLAAVHDSSITLFPELEDRRLKLTQFFVVSNTSHPARTLTTPFSFQLPIGAVLDSAAVRPPGTLPSFTRASACGAGNQYCVAGPMRPGETRIRVIYHLDFHGGTTGDLPLPRSVNQVLVKVPDSLRLMANRPAIYKNDGRQNGLSIYSVHFLKGRRAISFALAPATTRATAANAEPAVDPRSLQSHDADYEMRSQRLGMAMARPLPSRTSRSPLGPIMLLAVLVWALFGGIALLMSSRSSIRELVPGTVIFSKSAPGRRS